MHGRARTNAIASGALAVALVLGMAAPVAQAQQTVTQLERPAPATTRSDAGNASEPASGEEHEHAASEAADLEPLRPGESSVARRSIEERYVDALAGSWAATGLMVLGTGVTATTIGAAIGCALGGWGCLIGAIYPAAFGGALGWLLGPGIGTARGVGLDPVEALLPWALGVLTLGAFTGLGVGIGVGIDSASTGTGHAGAVGGLAAGLAVGAFAQVFLTPLYGVLLYEDRPEEGPRDIRPVVNAWAAPMPGGFAAGVAGTL